MKQAVHACISSINKHLFEVHYKQKLQLSKNCPLWGVNRAERPREERTGKKMFQVRRVFGSDCDLIDSTWNPPTKSFPIQFREWEEILTKSAYFVRCSFTARRHTNSIAHVMQQSSNLNWIQVSPVIKVKGKI